MRNYDLILKNAQKLLDGIDPDKFLNDFLTLQENAGGPTVDEFMRRTSNSSMVYVVGERCQYEGGGWSKIVLKNENAFANIKKVLVDYHTVQITDIVNNASSTHPMPQDECDEIDGHRYIISKVNNAKCIDELIGVEIPPYEFDIITIYEDTILV